jgi:hypothetical protein
MLLVAGWAFQTTIQTMIGRAEEKEGRRQALNHGCTGEGKGKVPKGWKQTHHVQGNDSLSTDTFWSAQSTQSMLTLSFSTKEVGKELGNGNGVVATRDN